MALDSPTSLILPAYVPAELHEMTVRCLASLERTTPRESYQLVVVDNGSDETPSRMLREWADLYVRKPEPIGYARAANIGIALADHEWIAVINTDIDFEQDGWLARLRADYAETPGGVLSAVDEEREGIVYDESWFSCWLTHRKIVQVVGYFDESMGFRFHDQDYAIRITQAGYRVMRDGNVQVGHVDSATYDVMDRDNDMEEEALMVDRWGASDFAAWHAAQ